MKLENVTPKEQRLNIVVKSNDLIQKSRFSLSAQQQKIILFIISQIEAYDEDFKLYEFKIADFCKLCGIEAQGDMYRLLKSQIEEITKKSLWIELEDGRETIVRWIEKPYISKRSGTIQIRLDKDMKPYLLQLKEKFTEYELIYTLNFKSKYSIRLYEYLKSIHYDELKNYTQVIETEKLKKIMDNNFNDFKNFHIKALKVAQQEINAYSDINFSYELVKDKKTVTHIALTISPKNPVERMKITANNEKMLNKEIKEDEE